MLYIPEGPCNKFTYFEGSAKATIQYCNKLALGVLEATEHGDLLI